MKLCRVLLFTIYPLLFTKKAPVAQLDRVPDYESGGRMFESCRVHHSESISWGVAIGRSFLFCVPLVCQLLKRCQPYSILSMQAVASDCIPGAT